MVFAQLREQLFKIFADLLSNELESDVLDYPQSIKDYIHCKI